MQERFYFHVCCQEERFSGSGTTCYDAAVAAVGEKRAKLLAKNTFQTPYRVHGEEVLANQAGVSWFMSCNNFTVAGVTRLVS